LALAKEDGDTASEVEVLRRMLEAEPGNAELRESLVRGWMEQGDMGMARSEVESWPEAPGDLVAIVQAGAVENDPDAVEAILSQAHARFPESREVTLAFCDVLERANRHEQIVQVLAAAPATDTELVQRRALARRDAGDFRGALADFAAARAEDSDATDALAPTFERLEAALPQLDSMQRTLSRNSSDLEALVTRAALWLTLGDRQRAASDARSAAEAHPGATAATILSALTSGLSPDRAIEEFGVVTGTPFPPARAKDLAVLDRAVMAGSSTAKARRAEFLNQVGQHRLALADAGEIPLETVRALVGMGRVEEASAVAVGMEGSSRARAAAWLRLGEAWWESGEIGQTLRSVERAVEASPSAAAYKLKAAALQRLGETKAAEAALERAARL
jgi:tetratricopeptide (TPR) repeat protein